MEPGQRPRPPVTVSAAGRGGPDPRPGQWPAEVLRGAPERPPRRRLTHRPRLTQALLAALALAVAAAGTAQVTAERRLADVVALTLVTDGGVDGRTVWELTGRTALVRYRAQVHNDGPRPVTVTRAELGGYRSSRQPRPLAPGAQVAVTLSRVVRCQDPQAVLVPAALSLEVTTQGGSRAAQLPVQPDLRGELDGAADRACGVLPLDEALVIEATSVQRVGGTVLVGLAAANRSTRPLRLARAVVQQGLRGEPLTPAGAPLALPLDLPPAALGQPPTRVALLLEVTVVRCAAIEQLTPAGPGQVPLDTLAFAVDGGAGPLVGPVLVDLDERALRILVGEAC